MEPATLVRATAGHVSLSYATVLNPGINNAFRLMNANTPARCAMIIAQCAEESGAFHWLNEFASGAEYEWRTDLGNTHSGDGIRYKGRSFIQITGRYNYQAISSWMYDHHQVPTRTYFLDHPSELGTVKYAWFGPIWYWNVARPYLNSLADKHDIVGATRAVNGGTNGLSDRMFYWRYALAQGNALLPSASGPTIVGESVTDNLSEKELASVQATILNFARAAFRAKENPHWNHKNFPDLINNANGQGILDRVDRLESEVAYLRHIVTASKTTPKS